MVVEFKEGGAEVLVDRVIYFPVWRDWADLGRMLDEEGEEADAIGITMTAEEADCFASKREGVEYIVSVCDEVFGEPLYLTTGKRLLKSSEIGNPLDLSAANWVASVDCLERRYGEGTLVDMGSTTTDIVPFKAGRPFVPKSDLERLKAGWLVYTGFLRTPVGGVVKKVPLDGGMVPISPELFAQTADVYQVLGLLQDYPCDTPDGGEKTLEASRRRVARHLCADVDEVGEGQIMDICKHVMGVQTGEVAEAARQVHRGGKAYCCGAGKEIALQAAKRAGVGAVDLSGELPAHESLPCYGLAHMVMEHAGD
jgi:hypothetical protein